MPITYIDGVLQEDELTFDERKELGLVELSLYEQLVVSDPDRANAVTSLASLLIDSAGSMWDALTEINPANTARPFAELITDQVLTAAITLVED